MFGGFVNDRRCGARQERVERDVFERYEAVGARQLRRKGEDLCVDVRDEKRVRSTDGLQLIRAEAAAGNALRGVALLDHDPDAFGADLPYSFLGRLRDAGKVAAGFELRHTLVDN